MTRLSSNSLVIVPTSLLESGVSCNAALLRTKHGAELWFRTPGGHLQYCFIVGRFVKLFLTVQTCRNGQLVLLCLSRKKQKAKKKKTQNNPTCQRLRLTWIASFTAVCTSTCFSHQMNLPSVDWWYINIMYVMFILCSCMILNEVFFFFSCFECIFTHFHMIFPYLIAV